MMSVFDDENNDVHVGDNHRIEHVDGDMLPQQAIGLQWHTVLYVLQDGPNGSRHPG